MLTGMMRFVGQITVTLAAPHRGAAQTRLRSLARQLSDCFPDVIFSDHRGEVDPYQPVSAAGGNLQLVAGVPLRFDGYEIHGVVPASDEQGSYLETVDDSEAELWLLYGHLPGQGLKSVGQFSTREEAETVYLCITGRSFRRAGWQPSKQNSAA